MFFAAKYTVNVIKSFRDLIFENLFESVGFGNLRTENKKNTYISPGIHLYGANKPFLSQFGLTSKWPNVPCNFFSSKAS